ncbi:MAG TPA: hypothetical protein VGC76_10125 [Pyrinomonadaceae bacterium]
MNSEELEQSLRTEFESYLKDVFANMRQEVTQFQEKINAELEKHKSQLDEVFQDFSTQFAAEKELDISFKESVVEHLRLARDEGARITATAFAEAEAMQQESAEQQQPEAPSVGISELRDAINDISTKNTQSSILKTLVQHAADFTPRGAFFIIKNEHLVGWRVFGKEGLSDEQTVREIFFPVSASTVLGEAVRSLSAVESSYGAYSDDAVYLERLEFGEPEKMFAIPLVVRERTVAVLYADNGNDGNQVNVDALETLAHVASLTVEVLASGRAAKPETEEEPQTVEESAPFVEPDDFESREESAPEEFEIVQAEEIEEPAAEEEYTAPVSEFVSPSLDATKDNSFAQQDFEAVQPEVVEDFSPDESQTEEFVSEPQADFQPVEVDPSWSAAADSVEVQDEAQYYEPVVSAEEFPTPQTSEYQFETNQTFEPAPIQFEDAQPQSFEPAAFETAEPAQTNGFASPQDAYAGFEAQNGKTESYVAEPVEQSSQPATAAQPAKTRFSDRNVDLPIEVGEEERRLHNDARRFARLLVSEIKLYNEQKVKEGRDASDLYERLREAIDRSREMYDKRVQPPVAARFDYFHYEIVNTLAEGDENRLGESYPGAVV